VTEYSDGIQEKCVDFYWKTCKIAFKERVFNATTRSGTNDMILKDIFAEKMEFYSKCYFSRKTPFFRRKLIK
jgi:hypothetical protein